MRPRAGTLDEVLAMHAAAAAAAAGVGTAEEVEGMASTPWLPLSAAVGAAGAYPSCATTTAAAACDAGSLALVVPPHGAWGVAMEVRRAPLWAAAAVAAARGAAAAGDVRGAFDAAGVVAASADDVRAAAVVPALVGASSAAARGPRRLARALPRARACCRARRPCV
jgi:hypothetical protein